MTGAPWAYRLVLRLLPRSFREEYGAELVLTLAERAAEVDRLGWLARGRFHLREIRAILRAARETRRPASRQPSGARLGAPAGVIKDFRYGLRALRRHPAHTVVAVVTLAVAIGATTAVFSVLNAVVLRPLPFPEAERLVRVRDSSPPRFPSFSVAPGRFVAWQQRARAFDGLAAYTRGAESVTLTGLGEPERLVTFSVSASFFEVMGVTPAIGRGFTDEEDRASGPRAIVLSHGFWHSRLAGRPDVVGTVLTIDDHPVTVVGVMPEDFEFPSADTRGWMPLRLSEADRRLYGSHYLTVIGRMRAGVPAAEARADLERAARDLAVDEPANEDWTVLVDPLHEDTIRGVRSGLMLLVGAACGVLLIACANVAGLLLARGADRHREIAVRSALGASRARLVRHLLIESATLGVCGSALGLLLAALTLRGVLATPWANLPRLSDLPLDVTAASFAILLGLATPLVFGLLPALQVSRASATAALVAGGRSGSTSMRAMTRSVLIVGEVALAVLLVTGSGLLIRSLQRLIEVDPGFRADRAVAVAVSLPTTRYPEFEARTALFQSLLERARAIPAVEHAALSLSLPLLSDYVSSIDLEGVEDGPGELPTSNFYAVSPGYFTAMGIPLRQGRDFTPADRADAPRVAIVSQTFADRIFPGQNPVGRRVRISQGPRRDFAEIVGVVGDVRQYGLDRQATLQTYEPALQHPYFSSTHLLLHTTAPADEVIAGVRALVSSLDSRLAIGAVTLLDDALAASTGPRRFTTILLGGLAAIALLLAAVGIYGLVSFVVGRRVQEFGIRLALGAAPSGLLRLVLAQGLRLSIAGIVLGVSAAWFGSQFVSSLLFEVSARDPLAFLSAPLVLLLATVLACVAPARRALGISPLQALRE